MNNLKCIQLNLAYILIDYKILKKFNFMIKVIYIF